MVGLHNQYWYYGAQRIKMVLNDKTIYVHAAEAFQGYVGEREREYSDYIVFEYSSLYLKNYFYVRSKTLLITII